LGSTRRGSWGRIRRLLRGKEAGAPWSRHAEREPSSSPRDCQALSSIKPIDGVFIGIFPWASDEVRENEERARRILTGA
jgi:hypothetical protein